MTFARRMQAQKLAKLFQKTDVSRRRSGRSRLRLEPLEDRILLDAGDTLQLALNTHVGPSTDSYTMTSEHLGDGAYGALDVDMYSFKAKAGEALTVSTSPVSGGTMADTHLRLFDSSGRELASNDDFNNSLYSRIQSYVFSTSGTYYVGVSGSPNGSYNPTVGGSGTPWHLPAPGDYRLDLNLFVPASDAAGDTLASAQATGLGPTDGTISVNGTIGDGLYLNNDVDLYKFTANAGQLVKAATSLPSSGIPMDTTLRLFDASGNPLTSSAFTNGTYTSFAYQAASAGTYYIGVSGYPNYYYNPSAGGSGYPGSVGDYHLDLSVATPVPDTAGDTLATAQVTNLTASTPFSATAKMGDGLYPTKDVDLYQIQVNAGQVLTALTSVPTGGAPINDIVMLIFDASGNQLSAYTGYNSSSKIDYQFATTGTYYVGISGYPNYNYNPTVGGSGSPYYASATGDYQIKLALVTPAADAAGDTLTTAQTTNLSTTSPFTATAKIGDGLYPLKDVDLYQFQVSDGQVLTAQTTLPTGGAIMTPILRLFDASGNQLGSTIFFYGSRLQYQFATAGTYYVGVSGSPNYNYNPTVGGSGVPFYTPTTGDYQLSMSLATPTADTAGDTLDAAQDTGMGPDNGSFSVTALIGDGLYPLRDVDLYKFQATATQGLIASSAQILRLFDSTGHQLASNFLNVNYPNGDLRYIFGTSGTYYIGVSGAGNGFYNPTTPSSGGPLGQQVGYQLAFSLVTPSLDNEGDTLATALATGFGPTAGTYSHTASIGDNFFTNRDVDLYSFNATAGERFSVSIAAVAANGTPLSYGFLRLFDSTGHQVAYGYSGSGIQNYSLAATGTYYLGISGWSNTSYDPNIGYSGFPASYTGDYSVSMKLVTLMPDAEGDTLTTAYTTGLGPTGGTFNHTAHIGDGLYPEDDVDLYRVDVNAFQLLRVMTSQPAGGTFLTPIVRLFDSSGQELAYNYSYSSANVALEYQFLTAGTYYVGISGYYNRYYNPLTANSGYTYTSTGDYHVDLNLITPAPDAEGDTLATALTTGLGPTDGRYTYTAKIGDGMYFGKDVDLYQLNAVAGQVVTAMTSVPSGGTPMGSYVLLFDASDNVLATGNNVLEYNVTTAGTYYLGVSGAYNGSYNPTAGGSGVIGQTGDYSLDLSLVTPTPDAVGDTIATALDTRLGPNAGTFSLTNMRLGDGLYVGRDVDMYEFRAQAGQVLTATTALPPGGKPRDAALSLFDSNGNLLAQIGSMTGNSDAQLQYTFASRGTYYLGVSAAPNYYYDPNTAGSGYVAGSGDYNLTLSLDKLVNAPVGGGGQHVQQVTGHAIWTHTVGLPSGGQNINQVSINAWLDASGTAHGTMSWITTDHLLPSGPDSGSSGYPWTMRVDTLIIVGNTVHVEGVVVRSGQSPQDIGVRVSWDIVVNSDGTNLLNGQLTDGGRFTIHERNANTGRGLSPAGVGEW